MRLRARPLPVADQNSWRWSAAGLRWARPAIRRFDWDLRPGATTHLTTGLVRAINAFDLQKRARETELAWCPSVSFVRKWRRNHFTMSWCENSKEFGFGISKKWLSDPSSLIKVRHRSNGEAELEPRLGFGAFYLTQLCLSVVMGQRHNLGTFLKRIGSIRPKGKSTKNWNHTFVGNDP